MPLAIGRRTATTDELSPRIPACSLGSTAGPHESLRESSAPTLLISLGISGWNLNSQIQNDSPIDEVVLAMVEEAFAVVPDALRGVATERKRVL